jgi:hypothetical protein
MLICYFVLNTDEKLQKAPQAVIEGIWNQTRKIADLGFEVGDELRIVSVGMAKKLLPIAIWLMRVRLQGDAPDYSSWLEIVRSIGESAVGFGKKNADLHYAAYHLADWPEDLANQLAWVLDVAPNQLPAIGWGGPLPLATQMGMTVQGVLPHIEMVLGKRAGLRPSS